MKKVIKSVLLLVILTVSAVIVVLASAGHLIKTKGAEIASSALGVPVSISSVSVDYAGQKIVFTGLEIGSPEGFASPHTMNFSSISVAAKNLFAKPMIIDSIIIGPYDAYYEMNEKGNNLSVLAGKAGAGKSSSAVKTEASGKKSEPFPVVVNLLKIENGTVHSSASLLGQKAAEATLTVPGFEKRNIGSEGKPADAGIVVAEIVGKISSSVLKQNPNDLLSVGGNAVEGVKNSIGGMLNSLSGN